MNISATLREALSVGGISIDQNIAFDEGEVVLLDESIPDGDDNLVALDIDISQLKAVAIYAASDLDLETNDGTTPDDTISLAGGKPFVWSNTYLGDHFTADITALYVSNGTGGAVDLEAIFIVDPTV